MEKNITTLEAGVVAVYIFAKIVNLYINFLTKIVNISQWFCSKEYQQTAKRQLLKFYVCLFRKSDTKFTKKVN